MREQSSFTEEEQLKSPGRWRIILAIAAAVALGAFGFNRVQQFQNQAAEPTPAASQPPVVAAVTALGRLEPQGEVIKISAPSTAQSARVEQLLVKKGQRVRAGDAIAILDNYNYLQAALERAKGDVVVARANLARVEAGAQQGEINAQKATIARLEAELRGQTEVLQANLARTQAEQRNAQAEAERYQNLYDSGAISAQELENRRLTANTTIERVNESQAALQEKVATLQQQLTEANAVLNKIVEVRPVDVKVAQAEVQSAINAVKQAEANLALAVVRAPTSGEVIEVYIRPGETIRSIVTSSGNNRDAEDRIVDIGRTDQMVVIAEVLEEDIGKVRLGQKATVTSENQAFPGNLPGVVTEIGRQVGKQDVLASDPAADIDARVVEVKINLSLEASHQVSGLTNASVVAKINI